MYKYKKKHNCANNVNEPIVFLSHNGLDFLFFHIVLKWKRRNLEPAISYDQVKKYYNFTYSTLICKKKFQKILLIFPSDIK